MRLSLLIFGVLAFVLLGFTAISVFAYRTPLLAEAKTVVIPPHTGAWALLSQLHEEGVTPSPVLMALPVFTSGAYRKLKAGEYAFDTGASPAHVMAKIIRGEIVVHKVTVPEGWNIFQVRAALMAEPLLTGDLPTVLAEGSVFPDTMRFTRGEARAAVLARMQARRDAELAQLWNARAEGLPVATPEQALILASIVERETGVPEERALVAGVFTNRLRIGMPLQSDPTVAYGIILAQGGAAMTRPLTSADLKADTPHNSYTRTGLPPTPICNPGRAAIEAALHPAVTDALYFVATGQGGHRFTATLEDHTRNVTEYRKVTRAAGKKRK